MLTTQSSYDESYLAAQVYIMQIEFLLQTDEIKRIEIIYKFNFSPSTWLGFYSFESPQWPHFSTF